MSQDTHATHTPTPWRYSPWHIEEGEPAVRAPDGEGGWIIATVNSDENAALIVRAVNSHAALIAALRTLIQVEGHGECPVDGLHPDIAAAWDQARAALALAEAQP